MDKRILQARIAVCMANSVPVQEGCRHMGQAWNPISPFSTITQLELTILGGSACPNAIPDHWVRIQPMQRLLRSK